MATVTVTYILEQDEGNTTYPSAAQARLQAAIANGTIVSFTKTPIVDGANLVSGKARANVVTVWKSAEDKTTFQNASLADAELQAYIISSNTRKINYCICYILNYCYNNYI
jgi:heme-degrading monooxygenase HmoA